jgi:hypothetical protein
VDPVPDPLLLRKSGSAGNRTRDLWVDCAYRTKFLPCQTHKTVNTYVHIDKRLISTDYFSQMRDPTTRLVLSHRRGWTPRHIARLIVSRTVTVTVSGVGCVERLCPVIRCLVTTRPFKRNQLYNDVSLWNMTPYDSSEYQRLGGTFHLHLQGDKNLSLPRSQRGRTGKRASCNNTSTVVSLRYCGIIVDEPLLRRIYHLLTSRPVCRDLHVAAS